MPQVEAGFRGLAFSCVFFKPQQFLYFFPLPQGQGSLRPTLARAGGTAAGKASGVALRQNLCR